MKTGWIAAIALGVGMSAGAASAVPTEWTTASGGNGHFYMLSDATTGAVSALDARSAAAAMTHMGETGYLATITSQEELDFLTTLVGAEQNIWLGGTDSAVEGEWRWDQGPEAGDLIAPFTAWGPGEPNDLLGEDYLAGFWNGTTSWNDVNEVFSYRYLVEFDPSASTVIPVPGGWLLGLTGLIGLGLVARRRKA